MNIVRTSKVKRGVALVFALMTIVILFSIATTVTAVSIKESKESRTVNYNDLALQAANWGLEAAIEYMGQNSNGGTTNCQWASNQLIEQPKTGKADIISLDHLPIAITKVSSEDLKKEYGLNYSTGTKLGTGNWAYGDSKKIVFLDSTRTGRYNVANGTELNNITVEVICTEYRNSGNYRPSSYELLSVAKVSSPSVNGTSVSIENGPSSKSILSTRVVRAMVRQEQISDFMHFVQNARTFDAIDTYLLGGGDLYDGLKKVVFLPQEYTESGRLRVDGFDPNKESNALKSKLHDDKVDGCIAFIGNKDANSAASNYFMTGDVTTNRDKNSLTYKKFGSSEGRWTKYGNAFQGALNVNVPTIGLPEVGSYYRNLEGKSLKITMGDESISASNYNNGFGCSDYDGIRKKNLTGKCPYVAQKATGGENGTRGTAPVFATTRVEIGPSKKIDTSSGKITVGTVRVVQYNSAMTNNSGEIDPNYVESKGEYYITDDTSVSASKRITGNTICVEGGNVEIVNVKKFASNGVSTDYVVDGDGYNNNGLYGGLTVASNVNATRETARKSVGGDGYRGSKSNLQANTNDAAGLYSDYARYFWKSEYNKNVAGNLQPPYSNAQLHSVYKDLEAKANEMVVKTTHTETRWAGSGKDRYSYTVQVNDAPQKRGWDNLETLYYTGGQGAVNQSKTRKGAPGGSQDIYNKVVKDYSSNSLASDKGKKYWPTMSSSGIENEGNTFIGSDLAYNPNNPASALGVVAKKSILLNDRTTNTKNKLAVNGMLMSIDHSLQFDWRNKAGNDGKLSNGKTRFDALNSQRDVKTKATNGRTFRLNGAIVGGFLDSEGDTFGRGYYNQEFKHDDNLLLNPPPNVPQWNMNQNSLKNFAILSYEDRGAINITD